LVRLWMARVEARRGSGTRAARDSSQALGARSNFQLRRTHPLFVDDFMRRSYLLPQTMPRHPDGWRRRWRALRKPVVRQQLGQLMAPHCRAVAASSLGDANHSRTLDPS
jgi:hypothetical protein